MPCTQNLGQARFWLCNDEATEALYALPLPAAHLRLGPMTLHEALRVLAGPAWEMRVDDVARQVCFVRVGVKSTGNRP
jgi:type IV pili sensor histidine kinase/response regulator